MAAGTRASHNWKRRVKLIERHTGKAYDPKAAWKKGKSSSSWNSGHGAHSTWESSSSWNKPNSSSAEQSSWDAAPGLPKQQRFAAKNKRAKLVGEARQLLNTVEGAHAGASPSSDRIPKQLRVKRRLTSKDKDSRLPKSKRRKKAGEVATASAASIDAVQRSALETDEESAKPRTQKARKLKSVKLRGAKGGKQQAKDGDTVARNAAVGDSEVGEPERPTAPKREGRTEKLKKQNLEKVKLRGLKGETQADIGSSKVRKRPAAAAGDASIATEAGRKQTRAQLRKAWRLARQSLRHTAHVICPGSCTDRFARGGAAHAAITVSLNDNERRLLLSGGLSWRWLRDGEDVDRKPPPVADSDAHWWALKETQGGPASERIATLDQRLGSDALWPPCKARVALASKLSSRKTLHKRCERYFVEVLAPLVVAPSSADADASAPLRAEARRLCLSCVEACKGANTDASPSTRSAWLQLLRRSAVEHSQENRWTSADKRVHPACRLTALLPALRIAFLARLCPRVDGVALRELLRKVASQIPCGAAKQGESIGSESANVVSAASAVVTMLPLGIFTQWQVLLLVALSRWSGAEATVVRRAAAGAAEVFFRSADVTAAQPFYQEW
eukprot:TRINITY_DN22505_c0_g1_i1.p1 TRINITY_DN22505_c0_g1~~TRINITY_DN22505_c0_g1_i1.p1  ORF type:complete len:617 (-),score=111.24 TRINITY_DN22505_c0_g1_i1:34-1884(-)